jgi:NAD(P)-dependent dehydrogenase (short-subunit alcohol dehydrogenase family)
VNGDRRIVVVTGGGGGIGAAIAEELGRRGDLVVTMDPLVTLDGSEQLPRPEETTAGCIVAAGGSARASSVSVTDGEAVRSLFADLVEEFGRLDAVVNVAGISRPTSFDSGSEKDWIEVLSVHLGGYLNILGAALPIMSAAGHGQILGVTSGAGWRATDAGAYGCAKRAVASLTWQLGAQVPPGVAVNAMAPIAMTRMVTAALEGAARGGGGGRGSASAGGLSLGSMPTPEQLGPTGAHLVGDGFSWCRGQVIFASGSEMAVIDPPRLIEVVRTDDALSLAHLLESTSVGALAPAEAMQASNGGGNPRFGPILGGSAAGELPPSAVGSCAVVSDQPDVAAAIIAALDSRDVMSVAIDAGAHRGGFGGAAAVLASTVERVGPLDAVVVALAGPRAASGSAGEWERVLAEHAGIVDGIHTDAGWTRAVADYAGRAERAVRLVTLTDATTTGGRSRAQTSAQLARSARFTAADRVAAFAVSVETSEAFGGQTLGEIAAHLVCSPEGPALAGAELVAGAGWFGLRSHPRPGGSVTFGGPAVPDWLDDTLRDIIATTGRPVGDDRRGPRTRETG